MTCDRNCESCEIENPECPPITSDSANARALSFAVDMMVSMDKNIPSDVEYENVSVSVNAARLAEALDLLFQMVDCYEGGIVDLEEMFEFSEIEASTPTVTPSGLKH